MAATSASAWDRPDPGSGYCFITFGCLFRYPDSYFLIPDSHFIISGSDFVIPGSHFVIPGSHFVIPGLTRNLIFLTLSVDLI
jgi:hypothetical protein